MSEETKARAREIRETATRLFAAKGFDGVSVRDICAELSVNCSTVSYYFGGKKGLYLEVLKSQFTAHGQIMETLAAMNLAPVDAIAALIELLRDFNRTHPHFAALLTRESSRPSPEFTQAAAEHETQFGSKLSDIIRNGQRQGVFKTNLKPAAVIAAINLLLNGAAAAHSFSENDYYETVKALILDGLAGGEDEGGLTIGKQSAKPRYRT